MTWGRQLHAIRTMSAPAACQQIGELQRHLLAHEDAPLLVANGRSLLDEHNLRRSLDARGGDVHLAAASLLETAR